MVDRFLDFLVTLIETSLLEAEIVLSTLLLLLFFAFAKGVTVLAATGAALGDFDTRMRLVCLVLDGTSTGVEVAFLPCRLRTPGKYGSR